MPITPLLLAALLAPASAPPAEAPSTDAADAAPDAPEPIVTDTEPTPRTVITVRTGARYELEAGLGDTGEIAVTRLGLGASLSQALGDGRHRATLSVEGVWSNYDLDLPAVLSPTPGLFDDVLDASLSLGLGGQLNDDGWVYALSGGVGFAGEPDADFGDSLTWHATGMVAKQVNAKLTLGLGVGVASRIEDEAIVFPVPIVRWAFAEGWRVETGADDALVGGGPAASLVYTPDDEWRFAARVSYVSRTYRLSDDAAIAEGVFAQSAVPVTFEAAWKPSKSVELRLLAGVQIAGEVETKTRSGSEISDESVDPQAFVGAELKIRF